MVRVDDSPEDVLALPDGTVLHRVPSGNLVVHGREGDRVEIENADFYRVMLWMFDSYLRGAASPRSG